MNAVATETTRSTRAIWGGRVLSGIAALFLAFDAGLKLLAVPAAVEGTAQLGYPVNTLLGIGLIQVVCLAVYLIPRTAPLGAILWTGYLGGAIATHVRVGSPLFTHILFPIYVAAFLWAGLWLRDSRVRALLAPAAPGGPRN
jgi:hypothetical protein